MTPYWKQWSFPGKQDADKTSGWLADADVAVSLEQVRRVLAKMPGTIAQLVRTERDER